MSTTASVQFGEFVLEVGARELRCGSDVVPIEPKAFDLLLYLIRHRDRVVSKQEILDSVWPHWFVRDSSLTSCVRRLRQALGEQGHDLIKAYYGRGYRFTGDCSETGDLPEPTAAPQPTVRQATHVPQPGFVGRIAEMSVLRTHFDRARAGQGSLVLLAGDKGMGKTRTVDFFLHSLGAADVTAVVGHCVENDTAPVLWPWVQVLRACAHTVASDTTAPPLGLSAAELGALVPELADRLPVSTRPVQIRDPGHARFRLFESVVSLLARAAAQRPLLLAFEDLHWADPASLLLLEMVTREVGHLPILLLGTYRATAVSGSTTLRESLFRLRGLPEHRLVTLTPLGREDVARLLEGKLARRPSDPVIDRIFHESEGNPFFVEHLVNYLVETGTLGEGDALDWEDFGVTEGVRTLVERRLQRRSASCRQLMAIAAVCGRRFDIGLLTRVRAAETGQPLARVLDATLTDLDEAVVARIIEPQTNRADRFQFVHALFRDSIYDGLGIAERSRRHRRVGEAIEAEPRRHILTRVFEMAEHYFRGATAGGADAAVRHCAEAGRLASSVFAYETAARCYSQAIDVLPLVEPPDPKREADLCIALAETHWKTGSIAACRATALRAASLARASGDARVLARAALSHGRTLSIRQPADTGIDESFVQLLEEANEALPAADDPLKALVSARLGWAYYYRPKPLDRRESLGLDAVEMAHRLEDPEILIDVLADAHVALAFPSRAGERLAIANELVRTSENRGETEVLAYAFELQARDLLEHGDFASANESMRRLERLIEQLHQPYLRWIHCVWQGMGMMLAGQFRAAEAAIEDALVLGRLVRPDIAELYYRRQIISLRLTETRIDAVEEDLRVVAQMYQDSVAARTVIAYLDVHHGRFDAARTLLDSMLSSDFEAIPFDTTWLPVMSFLGEIAAQLRDLPSCQRIYGMLLPFERHNLILGSHAVSFGGSVARVLGGLAAASSHWDAAARHFEFALRRHAQMGARPWLALTQAELAAMLLARAAEGDAARAAELLDTAAATATALDMPRLLRMTSKLRQAEA